MRTTFRYVVFLIIRCVNLWAKGFVKFAPAARWSKDAGHIYICTSQLEVDPRSSFANLVPADDWFITEDTSYIEVL